MDADRLITRKIDVLATELDGELVLMSIDLGQYFGLADSARRIWDLLDRPQTFASLLSSLAREYDAPPDRLRDDVEGFLKRLESEGLVQLA